MSALQQLREYVDYMPRSPEAVLEDLESLSALVVKWQRVQNLVSRETLDDIWTRHILDSLQLLPRIGARENLLIVDFGSGGGFPALPLAIALKQSGAKFHLVESNGRKCAYLQAVSRQLSLGISVHNMRIEALSPSLISSSPDILTSRALAPLPLLFKYLHPFWADQTRALLHKGRDIGEELQQADSAWVANVLRHPSRTDPDGVILEVDSLSPR